MKLLVFLGLVILMITTEVKEILFLIVLYVVFLMYSKLNEVAEEERESASRIAKYSKEEEERERRKKEIEEWCKKNEERRKEAEKEAEKEEILTRKKQAYIEELGIKIFNLKYINNFEEFKAEFEKIRLHTMPRIWRGDGFILFPCNYIFKNQMLIDFKIQSTNCGVMALELILNFYPSHHITKKVVEYDMYQHNDLIEFIFKHFKKLRKIEGKK